MTNWPIYVANCEVFPTFRTLPSNEVQLVVAAREKVTNPAGLLALTAADIFIT